MFAADSYERSCTDEAPENATVIARPAAADAALAQRSCDPLAFALSDADGDGALNFDEVASFTKAVTTRLFIRVPPCCRGVIVRDWNCPVSLKLPCFS